MKINDVYKVFARMKRSASCFKWLGLYDVSIKFISAACWWAYYFNITFRDDLLEALSGNFSQKLEINEGYVSDENKVVFYDSFAYDHRGLTQQYIRALMQMKVNLLFLTDADAKSEISQGVFNELRSYKNAQINNVPRKLKGIRRAQYIYDTILEFKASRVFMHLMPDAAETIIAMQALPKSIVRYQINLTDHAFWLGATALDYSFEFRAKGMKASKDFRKIDESRLLLCPYYPIIENIPFEGFPILQNKETIYMFSGGSAYKFIDEDKTFAHIIKRILYENPNAIWIHAGKSKAVEEMCKDVMDESLLSRILFIGDRKDIAEVFRHIDIYVSSYPMGGGLMSLYAAYYEKPIIGIEGDQAVLDEIVGQLHPIKIASESIDDLCNEAHKLITNREYRLSKAKLIHECVIDENKFNSIFNDLYNKHKNVLPYDLNVDVELFDMDKKLSYENRTGECIYKIVDDTLRWRALMVSFIFAPPVYYNCKRRIKRKIDKILHR